jgi:simple sugar transport system ATP-binding protein
MSEKYNPAAVKQPIKQLQMIDITKQFPGVLANDHVNLEVRAGEILALLV